jgi:hypothetical protein
LAVCLFSFFNILNITHPVSFFPHSSLLVGKNLSAIYLNFHYFLYFFFSPKKKSPFAVFFISLLVLRKVKVNAKVTLKKNIFKCLYIYYAVVPLRLDHCQAFYSKGDIFACSKGSL